MIHITRLYNWGNWMWITCFDSLDDWGNWMWLHALKLFVKTFEGLSFNKINSFFFVAYSCHFYQIHTMS